MSHEPTFLFLILDTLTQWTDGDDQPTRQQAVARSGHERGTSADAPWQVRRIDRSIDRSFGRCRTALPRRAAPGYGRPPCCRSNNERLCRLVSPRLVLMTTTGAAQSPGDWQDGQERADIEFLQRSGRFMFVFVRRCFEPSASGRRQRRRPDDGRHPQGQVGEGWRSKKMRTAAN
jgi:hypothetical protein